MKPEVGMAAKHKKDHKAFRMWNCENCVAHIMLLSYLQDDLKCIGLKWRPRPGDLTLGWRWVITLGIRAYGLEPRETLVDEEFEFDRTMRGMTMNGAKKLRGTIGRFHMRSRMPSTTVAKMNKLQLEHNWCDAPVLNARVAIKDLSKNCETRKGIEKQR
ncbi:hypothetical protein Sjap_002631 [Stephania japonica]|uniref:Uncharacterized protein n=1 Tax=Stephania japonica TaxID=461633 RepID=A0AAP0KM79_9MAGN